MKEKVWADIKRPTGLGKDIVIRELIKKLLYRLKENGNGIYASSHEILGSLSEEVHEFEHAVHDNDNRQMQRELLDIAVACVWGIVSLRIIRKGQK